jgi:cellulose synthase/poly-beta-1,6-N-acetylglucosamine synthase-like glycosyltransferase
MIYLVLLTLLGFLFIPYIAYYFLMKGKADNEWNLNIDKEFKPKVTLIIATFNEASVIKRKLENTQNLNYPEDRLQIIIIDSASTDGTLDLCRSFLRKKDFRFKNVLLLSEDTRLGKSHALNTALEYATGDIVATSDADSFLKFDVLSQSVPFFADQSVGALTGCEKLINLDKSVHTLSEGAYRKFYYDLRLGESKLDSTFIFQGELSLYRKSTLKKFEDKPGYSDDIGTVINIISKGYRCIFVPDAVFQDTAAHSLRGRIALKSRRAEHLISGVIRVLKLKIWKNLPLSFSIIIFNFHMHVLSPIILILSTAFFLLNIQNFFYLLILLIPLLIFGKSRVLFISYLTSNIALLIGLFRHLFGQKKATWQKIEEMRHSE